MRSAVRTASFLVALLMAPAALAQHGWSEGRYYETRGASGVSCGPVYTVYAGVNAWGYPIYRPLQDCQRRDWYSWNGTRTGYRWAYNGYRYAWVSFNDTRTWWSFTWYNYTRSL
ncbi:MAG: hypothetical protein AAFQ43_12245 [Bacteroidota bacterium]